MFYLPSNECVFSLMMVNILNEKMKLKIKSYFR